MTTISISVNNTDEELMALICEQNAEALAMLYDRHHRVAFSLAYRILNDTGQAEDVVQEAFLATWRHAPTFQAQRGQPRAWLLTIVRNRAINELRRGRPAAMQAGELNENLPDVTQPEVWQVAYEKMQSDEVRTALARLPEEQRTAVELSFFSGLSHAEIAERQAVPLGTIKSRIRLAFTKLQTALSAYAGRATA